MAADFIKKINAVLDPNTKIPENACEKEMLDTVEKKVKRTLNGQ
jgi:hypothetical protein